MEVKRISYLKIFFSCIFCVISVVSITAQGRPMIAVLPFESINVDKYLSEVISTLFETNLVNTGTYEVLSQTEREQILDAQAVSLSECSDESCAVQIGRLLSAEQIIIGTVMSLGTKYIINAKIIDVGTSKTLGADKQSADTLEDLDAACEVLTISLVRKAAGVTGTATPSPKPTPVPTPAATPAPTRVPEPTSTPEPEATPEPTEPPQPTKTPKPTRTPKPTKSPGPTVQPEPGTGESYLVPFLTISGGALFTALGNVASTMSSNRLVESMDRWDTYRSASENLQTLYSAYSSVIETSQATGIASYVSWGIGGGAMGAAPFLFPSSIRLSFTGRIVCSAGIALLTYSNVSRLIASNQALTARDAYLTYNQATENLDQLWWQYEDSYNSSLSNQIIAYICTGAGMAGIGSAFFLPGEKTAVYPGILHKALAAAGWGLITGGNITSLMAVNLRVKAEEAYQDYLGASERLDSLYNDFDDLYNRYRTSSIVSYALWGTGAAAVISSLYVPGSAQAGNDTFLSGLDVNIIPGTDKLIIALQVKY